LLRHRRWLRSAARFFIAGSPCTRGNFTKIRQRLCSDLTKVSERTSAIETQKKSTRKTEERVSVTFCIISAAARYALFFCVISGSPRSGFEEK
jgi:hypothetical protein